MNNVISETIPFYNMLLWLNMRTNAKNNMILGETVLENTPFISLLENSGIESIVKSFSEKDLNFIINESMNK